MSDAAASQDCGHPNHGSDEHDCAPFLPAAPIRGGGCCDRIYFCPTVGEYECPVHGGFDVCCKRPDLHEACGRIAEASEGRRWIPMSRCLICGHRREAGVWRDPDVHPVPSPGRMDYVCVWCRDLAVQAGARGPCDERCFCEEALNARA